MPQYLQCGYISTYLHNTHFLLVSTNEIRHKLNNYSQQQMYCHHFYNYQTYGLCKLSKCCSDNILLLFTTSKIQISYKMLTLTIGLPLPLKILFFRQSRYRHNSAISMGTYMVDSKVLMYQHEFALFKRSYIDTTLYLLLLPNLFSLMVKP